MLSILPVNLTSPINLTCIDWQSETLITDPTNGTNDTNHCSLFLNTMNELGLSQHCREITRPASGKTLDLILTNRPSTIIEVKSGPGMSDHNIVLAKFNLNTSRIYRPQRTILKLNQTNWDEVREVAADITTSYLARNPDSFSVQENGTFIETRFLALIDKHIPSKLSKTRRNYPWITPTIRKLQGKRSRFYDRAIKSKTPEHWHKFKQVRKECKVLIRTSHQMYLKKMFHGHSLKINPKPFWSYIKLLRKDNQGIPTLRTPSGIPAATNLSKANALVNQFTSVFTKENTETIPSIHLVFPAMPDITFGVEGIAKLLSNINHTKTGGPDNLPARFLKETANQIAPMYTHLFSQSYNQGCLPDSWTHAIVCPIFKKGNKQLPGNYRPVSLTAIPCKIFEHILVSQIWHHLNDHDIITSRQHGFRKGMSCETQLIEVLHDWTETMDQGQSQIDVIVLDFSKAFDTVPHKRLLQKLDSYGIRNRTLNWIKAFLVHRTHQVLVNGSHSKTQIVSSGVPQGTVLGPLLFLLYINDIEHTLASNIRLFADDSALYRKIDTIADAHLLQEDILRLQHWAQKWQMTFHIKKCKLLRISKRTKTLIKFQYLMHTPSSPLTVQPPEQTQSAAETILNAGPHSLNFTALEEIKSDKYLGIILDNKLSFNQHTDGIVKKTSTLLNLCRRNLYMCDQHTKELAYKAIVRPHLDYASTAWNPHTSRNIDKIESIQRRAARFILRYYDYGTDSHLSYKITHTLKWIPLQHRRTIYDLVTFYKIRGKHSNISSPVKVKKSPRKVDKYLHIQALHSEAHKYHFFNRTVRTWNIIPTQAMTTSNINTFKKLIKNWITPLYWSKINNTWTLTTHIL